MPIAIVFGDIVFQPLGDAWIAAGIMIFMASHAVFGLLLSLLPSTRFFIFGATSYQAIIYASIIAAICATGAEQGAGSLVPLCLLAVALTALLASALQVAIGALRLSFVLRSIPYPIISSVINVTALIIILVQLPHLLGLSGDISLGRFDSLMSAKPAVVANATISIALLLILPQRLFSIPKYVYAVGFSIGFHYLLFAVLGRPELVGAMVPDADLVQQYLHGVKEFEAATLPAVQTVVDYLPLIAFSAILLTVMNSLGTIASNQVLLETRNVEISSDKLIFRFGLANLFASPFVINGYAKPFASSLVSQPGSSPRLAGAVTSLTYVVGMIVLSQASFIPRVSLSILAIFFAMRLFDAFGRELFFALVRLDGRKIRNNLGEFITVFVVIAVELIFGVLIWAIIAGVVVSVLDFTYKISYFRIKEPSFASTRSKVERSAAHNRLLSAVTERVTIVRLDGFILFSVAENLFGTLKNKIAKDHSLILDFKGVKYVDRTGVEAIGRFVKYAGLGGCRVVGAGFKTDAYNQRNSGAWRDLRAKFSEQNQFDTLDHALEAVENLLISPNSDEEQVAATDQELDLFYGMDAEEIAVCRSFMDERAFMAGDVLAAQGSISDELYCITVGRLDISLDNGEEGQAGALRLASFTAGAVVGEMSFIDGAPRSASITAHGPTQCLALSQTTFKEIEAAHPTIAVALVNNLARSISYRLRFTNSQNEARE